MQQVGPGTPTPLFSSYAAVAQPFLTNGAVPAFSTGVFSLLQPGDFGPFGIAGAGCASGNFSIVGFGFGPSPIVADVDYGTLSYGDPFPRAWPRLFQYCQGVSVSLPRPNSSATDRFTAMNRQTTALPTGPVAPILTPVQNPTLNGASLFQAADLSTTDVNLSWSAPATGTPYGYYVKVLMLTTLPPPANTVLYVPLATYGTAGTGMKIPFLIQAGNTYLFTISAEMDPNASMETRPWRTTVPNAEAAVVSAPITIAAGAQ